MRSGKLFTILTALMLSAVLLLSAGCSAKKPQQSGGVTVIDNGGAKPVNVLEGDGVIGERKPSEGGYEPELAYAGDRKTSYDGGIAVADSDYYEVAPGYPSEVYSGIGEFNGQISAGTLTAGAIRDLEDLQNWLSVWNEENWDNIKKTRGLFADNVIYVKTAPLTKVVLSSGETVVYSAVSDIYGKAALVFKNDYKGEELTLATATASTSVICQPGTSVTLSDAGNAISAAKLDLMLMIDTTGSMGDELEYIKVELKDMIRRVKAEQNIDIRISVNFYRDEGDEYIVKYYDFRSDIDECVKILGEQYASGGGDYPEAVHTAISNVLQHNWRDDAVKLCFFVLDAPPHEESEIQGINASMLKDVTAMAAAGIRYIPVVSSGADVEVESLMRSFAVMTGGTYIFLTNDSGIGGEHQTPEDTEYEVEPLNDCMVRVIMEYLTAK